MLIMAANINIALTSGLIQCGSVLTTECTTPRDLLIRVDGTRSPAGVAADIVHGATHMDVPPGMDTPGEELLAWNRALNFYDRLPVAHQVEAQESAASAERKSDKKTYTRKIKANS